jgi:hypothetical protein
VYAGAVVDPKGDHGAIVYSASGTTAVRVTFHEFFALGSISGRAGSPSFHARTAARRRSRVRLA